MDDCHNGYKQKFPLKFKIIIVIIIIIKKKTTDDHWPWGVVGTYIHK
jgi:hypothetical protein